jgi:hypothetical protein
MSEIVRYFYAIFVAEHNIRSLLSALRFLCDPHQKYSAHVTVRGPYLAPLSKAALERLGNLVSGSYVEVYDVGAFQYPRQNTVFLHCDGIALPKVWVKPGRPYIPHLTLYDGASQFFARELVGLLRTYRIQFQFTATKLYELVSSNGQRSFELRASFDEPQFRAFMAHSVVDLDDVRFLDERSRLSVIRIFCDLLFERSDSSIGNKSLSASPLLARGTSPSYLKSSFGF